MQNIIGSQRPVIFLFPGIGEQYAGMGEELYRKEPVFRGILDQCLHSAASAFPFDLVGKLYPTASGSAPKKEFSLRALLDRNRGASDSGGMFLDHIPLLHVLVFSVEYALARWLMERGFHPSALMGQSLGELAAACAAGIYSAEEAIRLVLRRASLLEQIPRGAMLAIQAPASELTPLLAEGAAQIHLAVLNSPSLCLAAGSPQDIAGLENRLKTRNIISRPVMNSHPIHTPLMNPVKEQLIAESAALNPRPAQIPLIVNTGGLWLAPGKTISPDHWGLHLTQPAQIAQGFQTLFQAFPITQDGGPLFLEIGPGNAMSLLAIQNAAALGPKKPRTFSTLRHAYDCRMSDTVFLNSQLDKLTEALRLPELPQTTSTHSAVFPGSGIEASISAIWRDILGVEDICSGDNFFALGGSSIHAMYFSYRVQETFGCSLPLADLYRHPVLRDAASLIRGAIPAENPMKQQEPVFSPDAAPTNDENEFPLSFAQERLWFIYQLDRENPAYNIPLAFSIRGVLDIHRFKLALDIIIQRHHILRTGYRSRNGAPVQIVRPLQDFPIHSHPLADENDPGLQALLRKLSRIPFSLEHDPPFRVHLLTWQGAPVYGLLVFHHIAFDGISKMIFMNEWRKYYSALCAGNDPFPESAPTQYAAYADWHKDQAIRNLFPGQLEFWRRQFQDLPPLLELPYDFPRPARQKFNGAIFHFSLPQPLTNTLNLFIRSRGVTLFRVLLSVFLVLLYRCSGNRDIPIGIPSSNRHHPRFRESIGFFVNTLVLRLVINEQDCFRDILDKVTHAAAEIFSNQDIPFELLVERLAPQRDLSRSPFFQVMFNLHAGSGEPISSDGVTFFPQDIDPGVTHFDLTLMARCREDQISAGFEYDAALFKPTAIARMADHFQVLLADALTRPQLPVYELEMMGEEEKTEVLIRWNDTGGLQPINVLLHELVEQQGLRTPSRIAARDSESHSPGLSCDQLDQAARELAKELGKRGVGPGSVAALLLEPGIPALISMLAIMKRGGAFLPVDPRFPGERIRFILRDSGAGIILTSARHARNLPGVFIPDSSCSHPGIGAPTEWSQIHTTPSGLNESLVMLASPAAASGLPSPGDPRAYIIYTSGSTGQPNGVVIRHPQIVNFLLCCRKYLGMGEEDVMAAITTLSFDISLLENFLPLVSGAIVHYMPEEAAQFGKWLGQLLEQENITFFQAAPVNWGLLLESGWGGKKDLTAICGGDVLNPHTAELLRGKTARLFNAYGPTEATVWASFYPVQEPCHNVPVGRPVAGAGFFVLDERQQPVPAGICGELWISGPGLAAGYLNRPELTHERFVHFGGRRLYKTGDRVRWRDDGVLEFNGRLNNQVKIRGLRIELEEIEMWLNRHPNVLESAAAPLDLGEGDVRIIAYVTLREQKISPAALETYLKENIPVWMIPGLFIFMDSMPHTPNGKLERRKLPYPGPEALTTPDAFSPPESETERRLTIIWERILKISPVSVTAGFFSLGGYSLLAMRLFAAIEKSFGLTLPISAIFTAPTIRQLAALIDQGNPESHWAAITPLRPQGKGAPVYLMRYADGGVLDYHDLVRLLHPNHPVFGLQSRQQSLKFIPMHEISVLAGRYIREIQAFHPGGPCIIGGHSFGGRVAFEVAKGLSEHGIPVMLLILIDSRGPNCAFLPIGKRLPFWVSTYYQKIRFHTRRVLSMTSEQRGAYLWLRGKVLAERLRRQIRLLGKRIRKRFVSTRPQGRISVGAVSRPPDFIPNAFNGKTLLFKASAPLPVYDRESYGWRPCINGDLHIFTITGEHGNLTKSPAADNIAAVINRFLTE